MDEKRGLPSLPDKSIDVCITDIFFNVTLKPDNKKIPIKHRSINPNSIPYEDNKNDYFSFCKELLFQLERICNGVVIQIGEKNIPLWCKIKEPKGFAYHYASNAWSREFISHRLMITPLIFYGNTKRMNNNFFDYYVHNGMLRKYQKHSNLIHPCPLSYDFWEDLIKRLQPKTIIDPFLGSGTTAEVCTKLGIPWIGYEINKIYSVDIDKRLKNCKKEEQYETQNLFKFMK